MRLSFVVTCGAWVSRTCQGSGSCKSSSMSMTINIVSLQKSALTRICSKNGMTTRVECMTYRRQKMRSQSMTSTSSKVLKTFTSRFQSLSLNKKSSKMTSHRHFLTGHTNIPRGINLSVICKGSLTVRNSSSQTQLFTPPMKPTISEKQIFN